MNQTSFSRKTTDQDSGIISFFLCALILVGFLQTSEEFLHWFLIPVTLCGILIGIDAVNWFRSRLNIFDPVGILGLLGLHFFFIAPLLHVSLNFWSEDDITPPPDWRPWLGGMAILNFLGLLVYRFFRDFNFKPTQQQSTQTVWQLNSKRFVPILCAALMLSAILQVSVYQKFGGIANYIEASTRAASRDGNDFEGMGITFVLSESFPILSMMGFAAYARKNKQMRTWTILLLVLLVFLVLQMFFGGLRGSRSNTIWALFWVAGIIHFWLRRITKKHIVLALVFLGFFMYLYGFFKRGGLEGINTALQGQEARASLEKKTGRNWQSLVLQDLGRSDVQAFLLYRLMRLDSDYYYAWGRTYWAAISIVVPKSIWPDRPIEKKKEGTEAQFGMGTYHPERWSSSKVYGLAGEAMLNFGPYAIPFSFIFLGLVVRGVRRWLLLWSAASDERLLLIPMLVNFCFAILVSDLDDDVFFLLKNSGMATLVICLSCHRKVIQNSALNFGEFDAGNSEVRALYGIDKANKK